MLKVGIVGSRRRNTEADKDLIRDTLLSLLKNVDTLTIVSGGCPKGADRFAEELAEEMHLPIILHKPKYEEMKTNTRWEFARVCFERNTLIAQDSDILIAVVHEDRKGGTEDTVKKYKECKKFSASARLILL